MPHQLTFDSLDPAAVFDAENPQVWKEFCKFARTLIAVGRKRAGAKAIFERIRWEHKYLTNDPNFNLNNNYTAYYARKFMQTYPQHAGFFETRKMKGTRL